MSSRASARVQARSVRLRNEQIRALSDFNWFDCEIVAAKLNRVISATMKKALRKQIVKKAATILEDHLGKLSHSDRELKREALHAFVTRENEAVPQFH